MDLDFHIRYFIEHKALPSNLYSEGARLLSRFMISGKNAVLDYYKKADATTSYDCLFTLDDFDVNFRTYIRDDDSCMVLRIEMPEPEQPLLCRSVYLCYGTRGGYELYVTSELAEDGSYYICAWTERGQHFNFGDAPADPSDEMDMAAELFWRSIDYVRKIESEGLCSSEG